MKLKIKDRLISGKLKYTSNVRSFLDISTQKEFRDNFNISFKLNKEIELEFEYSDIREIINNSLKEILA